MKYDLLENIAQTSINKYDLHTNIIQTLINKYNLLANVIENSIHKYRIFTTLIVGPIDRSDIYVRTVTREFEPKDDATGNVFDYEVPVTIEVYLRDNTAIAERREPLQLIEIEKFLIELFTTSKYDLQNDGISHIMIKSTMIRPVDQFMNKLGNWYKLDVDILVVYRLKYSFGIA
jgi:hypothetical protein